MDEAPEATNVAPPFSTGGGGSDFERRVGAYYLAMALLRSIPRGQAAGLTREVRFQRLYEGDPLDDLIILSDLPVGESKLALQIKRDLVFGQADEIFDKVMRASWDTFKSPRFILGTDRFGIALGLYSKRIDEYYQSVLTWARNSVSASDFLSRVAKAVLSNKTQQHFVKLIRTKLEGYAGGSVPDHELWDFLCSMVILHFDFQEGGSRDQAYIVEMLSHILPPEKKAEAAHFYIQLTDYAAEANRTAGSCDTSTLRQRLQADGFPLATARDCRGDLEHLREHGRFVLGDIHIDIGGLILHRTSIVAEARDKMLKSQLLELIGPPGVGKSAILKALVESQQAEGFAIVLGGDRLTGVGWDGFASSLQLTHYLGDTYFRHDFEVLSLIR